MWRCRDAELGVFDRVHIMGILNVTPDSFSDGGEFFDRDLAVRRGVEMASEGADIIDVGGESTRPGAQPVSIVEELERVVPVIKALSVEVDVPISIDTTKSEVAEAAIDSGAVIVNDVSAMRFDRAMEEVVASTQAAVVLMHMLGEPRTMQKDPHYNDVVVEVSTDLFGWAERAEAAGVEHNRISLDPGIGFGKTREHNLALLRNLEVLSSPKRLSAASGDSYPILVGPSRKSFIGMTLDLPVEQRLEGTAAVVAWAVVRGANIVRVHDVKEMVRVVRMVEAIRGA